jgi:general secretion pathway protein G
MKTGFTLIELLVVVTILAILIGGALPFAQQYLEDSRYSRAKQDLDEIRNALIRFETDQMRPYTDSGISDLVGPYLNKGMADPWGQPYKISSASSTCYSLGADRKEASGDDVVVSFRPPLSVSRAFWEDSNKNTFVDDGDGLIIKFTRPLRKQPGDGPQLNIGSSDFYFSNGAPAGDFSNLQFSDYDMTTKLELNFAGATPFKSGFDLIGVTNNNTIFDGSGQSCRSGQAIVIKPRF